MKISKKLLISTICLSLISIITARPEEDYADDAIEPVKQSPLPVRGSPLLRRGPSPRAIGKASPTTTTTTTAKPEAAGDEEYDYEEGENPEQQEAEVVNTTTPKPSPTRLGAGGIRPFRSNDDLLAALLKRRREQASNAKANPKPLADNLSDNEDSPSPPKKVSSKSTRTKAPSRFSSSRASQQSQDNDEAAPAPSEASTRAPARSRFNARTPSRFDKRHVDVEGAGSETSQQVVQNPRSYRPRSSVRS